MAKMKFAGWGTYAIRKAAGMKAKPANSYNICIKGQLTGKTVGKGTAPKGAGGRLDSRIRANFKAAVAACKKS
jgi:hypothetical protein